MLIFHSLTTAVRSVLLLLVVTTWHQSLLADEGVSSEASPEPVSPLAPEQLAVCRQLNLDADLVAALVAKRLFEFSESEVDVYLKFLHASEPDLRRRIVHLARKNVGQPYEIFLLGEMPFEPYDPQPIYCLSKSDCVVFSEHTYAMALGSDWSRFMGLLQRIRYRDGQMGVATRNHYTEADWNVSNRWLVEDITGDIAGDRAIEFRQRIDRAANLKKTFGVDVQFEVEDHRDIFLPFEHIELADELVQEGDFVNLVRGRVGDNPSKGSVFGGSAWVGHVGLAARDADGTLNIIHSAKPAVREESFAALIERETEDMQAKDAAGEARLLGFKFLRLRDDPWKHLREIDGPDSPRVTLPTGN